MKYVLFILFAGLLAGGHSLVAEEAEPEQTPRPRKAAEPEEQPAKPEKPAKAPVLPSDPRELINLLSDSQLDQAAEAVRTNFLNPSQLNDRELKRAKLEGLLDRLGPGAEIGPALEPGTKAAPRAFLAEVLDGQIAYVRVGAIDEDNLAQLDAILGDLNTKKTGALILDLRSIPHAPDFETAADFARRFAPKGRLLFRLEKPSAKQERIFTSNQDPVFTGRIVVLTDTGTAGAAEILAGVLRRAAGAMVIGGATAGKPVEFASFPLGGGVEVRVAVAEAALADDERAFPAGVKPDLPVTLPAELQERIFKLSAERGVSGFVYDKERPRMNEAALIANANPEIDGSPTAETTDDPAEGLRDAVLQRAVDVVTALRLFEQ